MGNLVPVYYRKCLNIAVDPQGLYMAIAFPWRFGSPPLFIPWGAVELVENGGLLSAKRVVIRVHGEGPTISVPGPVGECIREAYMHSPKPALTPPSSGRL
jgi:hypothetical protein